MWADCYCFPDVAAAIWRQQEQDPTEKSIEAAATVMAIPELLGRILLHVRNRDNLAPLKKVSRLWKAEAERVEPYIPKPMGHTMGYLITCGHTGDMTIHNRIIKPLYHLKLLRNDMLYDNYAQDYKSETEKKIKQEHKRHRHPPPPRQSRQQQNPCVKHPYPRSRSRNGRR